MSKGKEGKWKSCIFQSLQHLCKPSLFCKGFQIQACPGSRNNVFEVAGADFMFRLIRLIDLWDRAVEFWWNTSPDRFSSQLFFRQDKWTCDAEYEVFLAAVNSLHFWKSNKEKKSLEGEVYGVHRIDCNACRAQWELYEVCSMSCSGLRGRWVCEAANCPTPTHHEKV